MLILTPPALRHNRTSLGNIARGNKSGIVSTSAEVYDYENQLKWALARLENSGIEPENKKLIQGFVDYLFAHGLSLGRIIKYVGEITRLAKLFNRSFKETSKQDIVALVAKIEARQDCSHFTKHDYKLALKKFFKYLGGSEEYPEQVAWIKVGSGNDKRLLPEELLTEEEVKRLADAARTPRDRALVLVLYDSGCRIGELLSLRIKNMQSDEYGAQLIVNGKTGSRRVRIIASAPALAAWLNIHPLRDDPNAPLWVVLGTRNRDRFLSHRSVIDLLKNLAKAAKIKKRVYPHLFRHSRATHLASHLTEAQMKQHFGWVQASDMASVYVHLSGRDVDKALLQLHGIEVEKSTQEEKFNLIICSRCKEKNSPDAKFCNACGLCFDVRTAMQVDELRVKADQFMSKVVERPEVLDALIQALEKVKQEERQARQR